MPRSNNRHPNILRRESACLLIIDVQERFRKHIIDFEQMTKNIVVLAEVANKLKLPIILSEQYPEGLGSTIKEILDVVDIPDNIHKRFAKSAFSCCQVESFVKHLQKINRTQILATGIESQVCVSQTVHDLIAAGYQTHIIVDAISSRSKSNKEVGVNKMLAAGAIISSAEMAACELLESAADPSFKYIQSLIK
jgi:nicotinamidase-related amidase